MRGVPRGDELSEWQKDVRLVPATGAAVVAVQHDIRISCSFRGFFCESGLCLGEREGVPMKLQQRVWADQFTVGKQRRGEGLHYAEVFAAFDSGEAHVATELGFTVWSRVPKAQVQCARWQGCSHEAVCGP